ncbi:MAG: carbohydrate esterase family 12 protein [Lachnospira sp.]|nr:carbohydrate esterase family 12 protein [Lachnospira sp.]
MRRSTKRLVSCIMCAVMLIVACVGSVAMFGANEANAAEQATVWVVGDSTVSSFTDNYYYPRYGWGTQLYNYFDETLKVENLALSGRSSKSFRSEANYTTLMNGMTSGDYLLIGFGHNDEKEEADRYTEPKGDYKTEGSFAHSLYTYYIKPAQDKGVTVVLCTPIVRRTTSGTWSNNDVHITSNGDYAESIRTLGKTLNIPVVDMTAKTKALYDELGVDETVNLHAWLSSKNTSVDNTHTNIWGAKYNAWMITQEMKAQNVAGIAEHITTAAAPTKADTLVSNPDYKEVPYSPVTGDSANWEKVGIWKPTVFGDVGGTPSPNNHTLEKDADGNIHMAVANNKGKIASTVDGIGMYYYKLPADKTFTLTATMTVKAFDNNNQVAFGLMARDAVWLDTNSKDSLGDYVAAGTINLKNGGWNCFARKNGTLTQGGALANPIKAGDTLDLKIVGTEDGYACTMGNEETISGGFDFKLTAIDSEYVYVGMFVSRNCDVTFANVKLMVDGQEVDENTVFETPSTGDDEKETGSGSENESESATGSEDESESATGSENESESASGSENESESASSSEGGEGSTGSQAGGSGSGSGSGSENESPGTGDNTNVWLFVVALIVAAGVACICVYNKYEVTEE